ncbi:MAG: hypothetical protein WKF37_03200 [Bryobacteraceae bacterium]
MKLVVEGSGEARRPVKVRDGVVILNPVIWMSIAGTLERGAGKQIHALLPAESGKEAEASAKAALQTEHQGVIVRTTVGAREVDLSKFTTRAAEIGVGSIGTWPEYGCIKFRGVE